MERLSQFGYLLGRPDIARLEIEAGIDHVLGWAFGMVGGLRIVGADGDDVSSNARREMGDAGYEEFMRFANRTLERAMLDGPADDEIPGLRDNGYVPEVTKEGQASRLTFELELSARLVDTPQWRRGRLRDFVSGREIAHE